MSQSLGEILKKARLRAGLSQLELARLALPDASFQSLVSRWEAGKVAPSFANIVRVAPILGLSLGDFTDVLIEEETNETTPAPKNPPSRPERNV